MKSLNNSFNFYNNIMKKPEDSKVNIIKLLEKILKNPISDIEFEGTEKFDNIVEYEFSLLKANVVYTNRRKG